MHSLPHHRSFCFRVLAALLLAALLTAGVGSLRPVHAADGSTDELGTLINRARVKAGLLPLARSAELDRAADAHSRDMVEKRYLDHEAPDGSTPQQRAERAGYRVPSDSGWIVVEVISAISAEPSGPLDWWLNESPEVHGKVLMNPRWREMGVGYARGGEYGNYWTVLVGCRPGVLPNVTLDGQSYQHTEQCGDPSTPPVVAAAAPSAPTPSTEVAGASAIHAAPPLALTRAPDAYASLPGMGTLDVAWADVPAPSETDWLGLYRRGDANEQYLAWSYVSCGRLATTPRPSGSCTVPRPTAPVDPAAEYEVRLFARNGYTPLSVSPPIQGSAITPSSSNAAIFTTDPFR